MSGGERPGCPLDILPSPTREEARLLERERDALLDACLAAGAERFEGNRAAVHAGPLSPGCLLCAQGAWSCLFVNSRCTRACFFCPQDRKDPADGPAREGILDIEVGDDAEYVRLVRDLGFRGVGFSGGEPLLAAGRIGALVRRLRREAGPELYLWAYSNGDPAGPGTLRRLADAGLDELRIDLSARGYDLAPVEAASRILRSVAVEIPAIPEDEEAVKALLPRMRAAGAASLHLHQLYVTPHNAAACARRGYTVVHGEAHAVVESELAALRIMRHALETGLPVPVRYCSSAYKGRFHSRGRGRRIWSAAARRGGSGDWAMTAAGSVRRVRAERPGRGIVVEYARPEMEEASAWRPHTALRLADPVARSLFRMLFVEGRPIGDAARGIREEFEVPPGADAKVEADARRFREAFAGLEHLEEGAGSYAPAALEEDAHAGA